MDIELPNKIENNLQIDYKISTRYTFFSPVLIMLFSRKLIFLPQIVSLLENHITRCSSHVVILIITK